MSSPAGRGAQVRLDGAAQAAARGALSLSLAQTQEAKRQLEYAGAFADGTTLDGSTLTGIAAEDEVLTPGGVVGGGGSVVFGQVPGTAAEGNDPRIVGAQQAVAAAQTYAPKTSPTFTGVPLAPTPAPGTASQQVATAQFVRGEIAALVNSSPTTLDTLSELAAALGNNSDFATSIANSLAAQAARIATLEAQIATLSTPSGTTYIASGYVADGYFATA